MQCPAFPSLMGEYYGCIYSSALSSRYLYFLSPNRRNNAKNRTSRGGTVQDLEKQSLGPCCEPQHRTLPYWALALSQEAKPLCSFSLSVIHHCSHSLVSSLQAVIPRSSVSICHRKHFVLTYSSHTANYLTGTNKKKMVFRVAFRQRLTSWFLMPWWDGCAFYVAHSCRQAKLIFMAVPFSYWHSFVMLLSYGNIHEGLQNKWNKAYNLNNVWNNCIDGFPRTVI